MTSTAPKAVFVIALGLSLASCARAVTIDQPSQGNSANPVNQFRVTFHPRFNPGTFSAEINGVDIASTFMPAPAVGGTSTAPAPEFPAGVSKLAVRGDFSPTKSFDMYKDAADFTPPPLDLNSPPPPPGPPCSSPCVVIGVPQGFDVRETHSATVTVLTPSAPPAPLTITITPSNNLVALGSAAAGAPITVTIPNSDRRADFTVRGVQTGSFNLRAATPGFQAYTLNGRVTP